MLSNLIDINFEELTELLNKPSPWHLLNEKKRKQYICLNRWVRNLNKPEVFEVEVLRTAKNKDGSFETSVVAEQIRLFLVKASVGHEYFAEKYLCISKIKFQMLMKKPIAWAECSEQERKAYQCCYELAIGGQEVVDKLKIEHAKASFNVKSRWSSN
jgi:hypothetical protein